MIIEKERKNGVNGLDWEHSVANFLRIRSDRCLYLNFEIF